MMNSYLISYAIISNFIGRFIESITIKFQKQLCDEEFTEKSISEWQVLIIVSRPGNDGLTKEYSRNSGKILKTSF